MTTYILVLDVLIIIFMLMYFLLSMIQMILGFVACLERWGVEYEMPPE